MSAALATLAAMVLALTGCSSSASNSGAATATQSAEPKTSVKDAALVANAPASKSVFSLDKTSRDPFFPKAKRVTESEPTNQPAAAIDIIALLREGFQGVIGSGENRIALINNVMLEPGRQTVIPISAGGQSRSIPVRCREVLRDAVVLEVQGYPQPVRIVKTANN
jgi:hypothetical protein